MNLENYFFKIYLFQQERIQDLENQMKDKLKEYSSTKISEFAELKNEHQLEIEKLKKENEKILFEKINQVTKYKIFY